MDLDNLKDRIKDVELDFDQNEVWASIQQEQRKEKKRFFFWRLLMLVGFVMAFALCTFIYSTLSTQNENQELTATQNRANEQQTITSLSEKNNDEIATNEIIEQGIENEVYLNNLETKISNNQNITSLPQISKEKLNRETTNSNILSQEHAVIHHSIEKNKENNVSNSRQEENYFEDILNENSVNDNLVIASDVKVKDDGPLEIIKIQSVPTIFISDLEYTIDRDVLQNLEVGSLNNQIEKETSFAKGMSIMAVAQYGKLTRELSLRDANTIGSTLREESEKVLDQSIVGVQIRVPLSDIFFVMSGLEYSRLSSMLEYTNTSIRPLNDGDLPNGVQGVSGFVINNTNSKYYNYIDLVNIPISVGAKWRQSKWSESISVGTSINLYTSSKQLYLDEWRILTDESNFIRTKFNNSYMLSASVAYNFWSHLEWSIHASYRNTPNVMNSDSKFSQSFQSYLLGTGIVYQF